MKITLVGAGGMGANHIQAFPYVKGLEVMAIVDANLEIAQRYAKQMNCRAYHSLDEMLEHEQPDAVDICVPSFLHTDYALKCIDRGLHVFCEKPMAHTCREADEMIARAAHSGVKLMVGQVLRYWPEYRFLKACIDDQRYGKLCYLSLTRQYGMHPEGSWYLNQDLCKMVCYEMHIHDTDMVNYLFGLPDAVDSVGSERPEIHMSYINTHYLYHGKGFAVSALGGWNDSTLPWAGGYLAAFEHGTLEYKNGVVTCYPSRTEPFTAQLETLEGVPSEIVGVYQELTEFVDWIAGRIEKTAVTPQSARNTIFMVEKECESVRTGQRIAL